jgi:hypothetical protein
LPRQARGSPKKGKLRNKWPFLHAGAKGIELRGLHVRHARSAAVVVQDAHDTLIDSGSVALAGSMGVNVSGGSNVTVSNVHVFGCGSGKTNVFLPEKAFFFAPPEAQN